MKNVLLVDDDETFCFINKKMLIHSGLAGIIHSVQNGSQALEYLLGDHVGENPYPDVIFLDLNMPIMDGFDFLEMFYRTDFPHTHPVKIVVVTSSEDPQDKRRACEMGADTYLVKPISLQSMKIVLGD